MLVQLRIVLANNVQCLHQSNTMSSTNQFTGPSASTVAMSARQEFTPEQLERIKSVVNCLVTSSGLERTPGSAVADFLHTQDLMSCRTGPITPVKQSPPISFLDLPAEVRNKIYRHCLVVGSVFPRRNTGDSRTVSFQSHEMPQTAFSRLPTSLSRRRGPCLAGDRKSGKERVYKGWLVGGGQRDGIV